MTDNTALTTISEQSDLHLPPIWTEEKIAENYLRKSNGKLKSGLKNIFLRLRHSQKYHGIFRWDALRKVNMVVKPTFWDPIPFTEPRPMTKIDITYVKLTLEMDGVSVNRGDVIACINAVSRENYIGSHVPEDNYELLKGMAIECLAANPHYSIEAILKALNMRDKPKKRTNRILIRNLLKEAGYENREYLQGKRWEHCQTPYFDKVIDGHFTETTQCG